MIDLNPQVMLLLDRQGVVVRSNRSLMILLGTREFGQLIGKRIEELFVCSDPDFFTSFLAQDGGYLTRETRVRLPYGPERELQFTLVGVTSHGDVRAVVVTDVTNAKAQARTMSGPTRRRPCGR